MERHKKEKENINSFELNWGRLIEKTQHLKLHLKIKYSAFSDIQIEGLKSNTNIRIISWVVSLADKLLLQNVGVGCNPQIWGQTFVFYTQQCFQISPTFFSLKVVVLQFQNIKTVENHHRGSSYTIVPRPSFKLVDKNMWFPRLLSVFRSPSENQTIYNKITNIEFYEESINTMFTICNGNVWLWLISKYFFCAHYQEPVD